MGITDATANSILVQAINHIIVTAHLGFFWVNSIVVCIPKHGLGVDEARLETSLQLQGAVR